MSTADDNIELVPVSNEQNSPTILNPSAAKDTAIEIEVRGLQHRDGISARNPLEDEPSQAHNHTAPSTEDRLEFDGAQRRAEKADRARDLYWVSIATCGEYATCFIK